MALRVIGSGVGRTGTTSLKAALTRLLGAPCYHMVDVFARPADFAVWTSAGQGKPVDWHALYEGFAATCDWPSASFWPDLLAAFPDALVVHSTRDAESWWRSARDTIFSGPAGGDTPGGPPMRAMLDAILGARFTRDVRDHDAAIAAYERHNAHVLATAPRDRLVQWSVKDGWGPLCAALGLPVPAEPFPHANTTEDFRAQMAARNAR
jgi:hypothetical protein